MCGFLCSMTDKSHTDEIIGARIRLRRMEHGVTPTRLAEIVCLTLAEIQSYEDGDARVPAAKLLEIAAALDAKLSYFFAETEAPD